MDNEKICNCFPALKNITLEREERYSINPQGQAEDGGPQTRFGVEVRSVGYLNEVAKSFTTGRSWKISEPIISGGVDDAPYPLEYLLAGAVGCFSAVFAFYASKYNVDYDAFRVEAWAEFDASGHMIENAPPSGFKNVELNIEISGNCNINALQRIKEMAMKGCPGIQTLRNPVAINSTLSLIYSNDGD